MNFKKRGVVGAIASLRVTAILVSGDESGIKKKDRNVSTGSPLWLSALPGRHRPAGFGVGPEAVLLPDHACSKQPTS